MLLLEAEDEPGLVLGRASVELDGGWGRPGLVLLEPVLN